MSLNDIPVCKIKVPGIPKEILLQQPSDVASHVHSTLRDINLLVERRNRLTEQLNTIHTTIDNLYHHKQLDYYQLEQVERQYNNLKNQYDTNEASYKEYVDFNSNLLKCGVKLLTFKGPSNAIDASSSLVFGGRMHKRSKKQSRKRLAKKRRSTLRRH